MGLDIIVHAKVVPTDVVLAIDDRGIPQYPDDFDWDAAYAERSFAAFAYSGMEQSLDDLTAGRIYRAEGEDFHFRAGSYSGYGEWRADLASFSPGVPVEAIWADRDDYRDRPFYELLNFADNEGVIGPMAADRLAQDFHDKRDAYVVAHGGVEDGNYMVEKYDDWLRAFDVARSGGAVVFS